MELAERANLTKCRRSASRLQESARPNGYLDLAAATSPGAPSDFKILYENARAFVMDQTHFYWLNREQLVAAPIDLSGPPVVLARKCPEEPIGGPHDCFFGGAMHVDDQHVYWSPLARVCRISKRPPRGP